MAAVIIAPHSAPSPQQRRPHLRPVPDLPARLPRSERSARHSIAVYRRRRVVVGLAGLALMVMTAVAVLGVLGTVNGAASSPETRSAPASASVDGASDSTYVVRTGDTIWAIARRLHPEGDVRALVDALAERTGGADLRPGQTIDLDGLG